MAGRNPFTFFFLWYAWLGVDVVTARDMLLSLERRLAAVVCIGVATKAQLGVGQIRQLSHCRGIIGTGLIGRY